MSPPTHAYDQDRTHTIEQDKTYSMAFAKKQAVKAAAGVQMKSDIAPPRNVDINQGISLEGHSFDRDRDPTSNKDTQSKKKPRKTEAPKGNQPPPKLRSGPLGYEPGVERRPSIERGGTNTIEMEVSGIGSRGSSRGKENITAQAVPSSTQPPPQAIKENSPGRKQQKRYPVAAVDEADMVGVQSVVQYASSKPPVPQSSMERLSNASLSAPTKNTQKKIKKTRLYSHHQTSSHESGYGAAGDETAKQQTTYGATATPRQQTTYGATASDMDSSMNSGVGGGGGGSGSPGESQLIELQPFSNPEHGLRDSIAKIDSEDWSAKCDGMVGIRQVAMYHPAVLQPHLHTVVLAVQKEVS